MVADAITPVLRSQSEIRERIIGIDGNGTGREGALQRQDKKLQQLDDGQLHIIGQLSELTIRSQSWNKRIVWEFVKWVMGGIGAFSLGLASLYVAHKMGWK